MCDPRLFDVLPAPTSAPIAGQSAPQTTFEESVKRCAKRLIKSEDAIKPSKSLENAADLKENGEKPILKSIARCGSQALGLRSKSSKFSPVTSPTQENSQRDKIAKLQLILQKELAKEPAEKNFDLLYRTSQDVLLICQDIDSSYSAQKNLKALELLCRDIKATYPPLKRHQTALQQDISCVLKLIQIEILRKGSLGQLTDYLNFIEASSDNIKKLIEQYGQTSRLPISSKAAPKKYYVSSDGLEVNAAIVDNSKAFVKQNLELAQKPLDPSKPPPAIGKEAPQIFNIIFLIARRIYRKIDAQDPCHTAAEKYKTRLDRAANKPEIPKNYPKITVALNFFASLCN